jgi:cytochrome oxidase Cu insertion factor (SCO1/SenC/PrrC family)
MKQMLLFFAVLAALTGCSTKEKEAQQEDVAVPNDLPAMTISLPDGRTIDARTLKGKNVLVLFQPDCDHCQHEAEEVRENLEAFRDYTLYFISSAPMAEIEKFASDYKLSGNSNVVFGWTATENVLNNFGPIQAPSVYIYADQGRLVQKFNGQTDVGVIVKYL